MRYFVAASLFLTLASPALAHRLHCEPRIVGDRLRVEAFYADDTPAQDAKVSIHDGETLIAEGRTDEKGVWSCPRPAPGTYTVRVESVGHAAKETIEIQLAAEDALDNSSGRAEKIGTHWGKLGIGLAIIAGLCGVWMFARRSRRESQAITPK